MEAERIKFKNILKGLVNNCEKFANILETYTNFKEGKTQEELEKIIEGYTDEEIDFIEELNERYDYHLDRINKM